MERNRDSWARVPDHPGRVKRDPDSAGILANVNPRDRAEILAQEVTERVVDVVVGALGIDELAAHVDLNALEPVEYRRGH